MVSRAAPMPLNGQQLMMQLDGLTSAMTGMSVQEVMVMVMRSLIAKADADANHYKRSKSRRQWSLQRRMTLLTARLVGEETQFTSQAWPRMLYLPPRFAFYFPLPPYLHSISMPCGQQWPHTVLSSYSSCIDVL